jgi:hypothetical protein
MSHRFIIVRGVRVADISRLTHQAPPIFPLSFSVPQVAPRRLHPSSEKPDRAIPS